MKRLKGSGSKDWDEKGGAEKIKGGGKINLRRKREVGVRVRVDNGGEGRGEYRGEII